MSLGTSLASVKSDVDARAAKLKQLAVSTDAFKERALAHGKELMIAANKLHLTAEPTHWKVYEQAIKALTENGFAKETKERHLEAVIGFLTRLINHNLQDGKTVGKADKRLVQIVAFIESWEIDPAILDTIPSYAKYPGLKAVIDAPSDELRDRRPKRALLKTTDSRPDAGLEASLAASLAIKAETLSKQVAYVQAGGSLSTFTSSSPSTGTPPTPTADDRRPRIPSSFERAQTASAFRGRNTGAPASPAALLEKILSIGKEGFVDFCDKLPSLDRETLVALHHTLSEEMKNESSKLHIMFCARKDTLFGSLTAPTLTFEDGVSIKVSQTFINGLRKIDEHIAAASSAAVDLGR